jgi:hypothetical protein
MLLGSLLWSLGLRAEGDVFDVPAGCGSPEEFLAQAARLLGAPQVEALPSSLRIEQRHGGASFRMRLTLGQEVRELNDPSCQTLFRSAVVIVAAGLRGETTQRSSDEVPALDLTLPAGVPELPAPRESPAPAALSPEPMQQRPPPVLRDRAVVVVPARTPIDVSPSRERDVANAPLSFEVGLGAGAGIGTTPGVGPSFTGHLVVSSRTLGARLSAHYWPGMTAVRLGRGVLVSALGAELGLDVRIGTRLRAAAGFGVKRLEGSGRSVAGGSSDSVWDAAPSLEAAANIWNYGSIGLELGARAELSLVRPRFVVAGFGDIYRVPAAGGAAILRFVFRPR